MKNFKLIYNSIAGQSKFKYFLDTIIERFMSAGYEVSIFRISKKTNLFEFVKAATKDKDCQGILIAGGDGTINKVINIMMKNGFDMPVGIIPAGTSNDFARHIKMPKNFKDCIDRILKCNIQPVDVGMVNDKYFINICSAGLFTNVSQKTDINLKNLIGKSSYFLTAVYQMFRFKPIEILIETKTKSYKEKVYLFLVFNGTSVGGLDMFTHDSSIQDGVLDAVILKNCSLHKAMILTTKLLARKHYDDENVIYLKEDYIKISKVNGECDQPDVDGEEGPTFPLEIKCIKAGIKMFL
ncbi:MAG: YegS/Rv2252/BmrU family lipid kinase [Clostridia bacterium]